MNTQTNNQPIHTVHLWQSDIDAIYRKQQRIYWEADFVNRCIDRYHDETGLYNIPLESVADNTALLDMAYELYTDKEDCNVAYTPTPFIVRIHLGAVESSFNFFRRFLIRQ